MLRGKSERRSRQQEVEACQARLDLLLKWHTGVHDEVVLLVVRHNMALGNEPLGFFGEMLHEARKKFT